MSAVAPHFTCYFAMSHHLQAETLSVRGPDAVAFAHAQLSSDVKALAVGSWQWSAWLTPQGRVRALLHVVRVDGDHLLLLLRGGRAADLAPQLKRYVLRQRVTIEAHDPQRLGDADSSGKHAWRTDGDDCILDTGRYAMRIGNNAGTSQQWRLAAIENGHPWLPAALLEQLPAPALSLEKLGAVSLDKGCYPGQEIVARLHYRGGAKQHLWRIESDMALTPGDTLEHDGKTAGKILDSVSSEMQTCQALAVLRDTGKPLRNMHVRSPTASNNVRVIKAL